MKSYLYGNGTTLMAISRAKNLVAQNRQIADANVKGDWIISHGIEYNKKTYKLKIGKMIEFSRTKLLFDLIEFIIGDMVVRPPVLAMIQSDDYDMFSSLDK